MTLLVSFLGVDHKKNGNKPSSIYIVSDSRISWGKKASFDYGQKVFGCKNSADIFGYCGDVLFPSIVLNQIVNMADQGLLFEKDATCKIKFQMIFNKLIQSFNNYPKVVNGQPITSNILEIIHASRDNNGNFFCKKMKWENSIKNPKGKWRSEDVKFGDYSDKLFVVGSGKGEFLKRFKTIISNDKDIRTSRAIFKCFCDTLSNIKSLECGGAPQLVGLYRKFDAQFYGIINDKKRYYNGLPVSKHINLDSLELEWRNELFEICDGKTMKKKPKVKMLKNHFTG